ncbi:hypothetical protein [Amycolatopsis regifaucium]|uniref:Uncharacterized protein n=1 Tax=Amycolatopsis regifaucium TaxID=546365 RepID=A0A154MRJ1_9PSEU|nr:hypothetical protein [Amycolatopsis regifaucium]KZB86918.1 hypothetical protein AVL48_25105 [Amycolatopsis regifaucium]OKA09348.1 hypothetical protein ATP06_0207660 [Amycolatopsis regifaucium]SFH58966.1 hypothetical protein SAMN04489731_105148 [Amycolatopsis regifaucium]
MADSDNRPFHVVTGVLTVVAALLGHSVTLPHPQAWLFGAVAALAVLIPAEVAFFVLSGRRPAKRTESRAPEPTTGYDHYSLLGRALTAIEAVRPGETELAGTFRRAVAKLEDRAGDNETAVVELRVTVKQTTEKLERHARDENPDPVMLVQRMMLYREQLEDALAAAEAG